jgi:hypothetical protein
MRASRRLWREAGGRIGRHTHARFMAEAMTVMGVGEMRRNREGVA